ncbi:MAG: twin-arginine translocase TatA/TatE family subunit [bacterium]
MGRIGVTEILLIIVIILLLFGARRIPDLMRALGSGVREFRKGVRGEEEEPKKEEKNKNLPSDQT